jgi:hypothetical protein
MYGKEGSTGTGQNRMPETVRESAPERRGDTFACCGTIAVIGASTGVVTILDFSDVLATLGIADQALSHSLAE